MGRYLLTVIIFSFFALRAAPAQILVEAFRSIGCVNCVDPDKKYEDFMNANPKYKINIVYVHNNIATSDDPFYAASKQDIDARQGASFYFVSSDPVVFISGFNGGAGGNYESNWEKLSADPASAQYSGTLTATASVESDGRLLVKLHAIGSGGDAQVRPYAMLVESGISYHNLEGYGNPPGNIWNNVFRAMIPGSQGGPVTSFTGQADFSWYYVPASKPWNLDNCKIYAFMQEVAAQSDGSHAIDAFTVTSVTKSAVRGENSPSVTMLLAPVPNPLQGFTRIPFSLSSAANVKIVICDDLGREVSTIINEFVSDLQSSAMFIPDHLPRGIYYARMYSDGAFIGMQKIVFAP